jgi:hypothetical protein
MPKKITRQMLSLHQGVGVFIGIQIFLWISGGFVMSALPIEKVRGEDWIAVPEPREISPDERLRSPNLIANDLGLPALHGAELTSLLGRPVYRLQTSESTVLVDAVLGKRLSPLSEEMAREVALADYAGPGTLKSISLFEEPISEIRGRDLPLWRADFADSRHTTLYVSPNSGQVVAHRNNIWRVYDFFWMLHIMDYGSRDNFNNPLLVTAAVIAWLMATSGLWLAVVWVRRVSRRRAR